MKPILLVLGVGCLLVSLRANAQSPAILSEPQSVIVNNASAANFTVVASNAVAYQWQFQGTNNLMGETNATLSLDDVSTNQAGSYTVVVTSLNNISVTSAPPAVLTIVPGTIIQWTISKYADGSSSNFLVQLFDHDKPATVENFIHYITSGSYSNMFFDRDVANFVLQGGDYVTVDRTTNGLNGETVSQFVSTSTNIFPSQVDNEFSVGPLIHNRFGTLAMALASGESNSASSAFFFNLVDNSVSLDAQDFTVFGRILSGANTLQYFNTLNAPTNGIFDLNSTIPTLPVNYDGTNQPTDANLFYCDFAFQTPPPVDTTPPTVAITFPAPDAALTNSGNLTVIGTASDNVGVAEVYCVITALAGVDEGESQTNAALGTTNWSLGLGPNVPGIYQLTAFAQDGAGNLSAPATEYFTNMVELTIITNLDGELTTNQQYLVPGQQYSVAAEPGAGERFVNWQIEGEVSLEPEQTFTAETNFMLTVTYLSTNLPAGLAITSPVAGSMAQTTNAGLTISGTLPPAISVTQLTVQLFAQSKAVTAALLAVINGTNWSLAVSNLLGGPYTIVVVAEDSIGQEGLVTENFTALVAPPTIITQPQSITANTGSSADFTVTASNAVNYQWQLVGTGPIAGATNATLALNNVNSNQSGSSYTVLLTAPDGETAVSTPAVLTIVQGTIIQWTVSKYADGSSSNFLVELFDHDKPATVENFIHYIVSGSYSNTFFDTDETNFVLLGGDYVTVDRTTNYLAIGKTSTGTNLFPSQIDSEFNVGPLIPNTFGTLAALGSGSSSSGTSGFFFNLADNSTNLDTPNGGYTVFGRILSGPNILQYFNTLSAPSHGLFDETNYNLPALPVDYDETNAPTDASLFYCDFKFQTPPPVDTTPPTVAITFPAPNATFTNGSTLTLQGTAQDNVGLAEVFCVLTSPTGAYGGQSQTNTALGTTNWSLNLGTPEPGVYQLTAYAQDGAGNLSARATEYFTNLAELAIVTNVDGQLTTSAPQYLVPGQQYSVMAVPGPGQQFYSWTSNGVALLNPVLTFTADGNLNLMVTYFSTNLPAALTITSPVSGTQALSIQSVLTVTGTVASTNFTQVTCQFFVNSNSVSAALPANVTGTNWSLTVTNYANGSNYTVVALAANATGGSALASANFSLLNVERLAFNVVGNGTVVSNPGPYIVPGTYTVKAVPKTGQVFYSWSDGFTTTLNPSKTFQITSNLTLTATFVPEDASLAGITFTYPPANAMLTNGTFSVAGKLPTSLVLTQMTCQLFLQSNGVTVLPQPVTIDSTGAKWTLPVTNLTPGSYSVLALGYDSKGNSRLVAENFNLLAKCSVGVQPASAGTVTAGLNEKYLEVGKTYTVAAKAKAGQLFLFWTGNAENTNSAATTFVMSTNTVLTACFTTNLFPAVAGTYTGLFLSPAGVSPTNAGFVTLTAMGTGAFSGQLVFPSHTYPFAWHFPYTGSIALYGTGLDSNLLELALNLDLTNGADTISGFVADQSLSGPYIWASSLVLHRGVTALAHSNAPAAGKYVMLLQPETAANGPVASGYAAASLAANGVLALGGALPDSTAIGQSARISKDGIWPVYIVPTSYKGKGMIIGWQTNTPSGSCDGQLFWYKPASGFAANLISTGAEFAAPVADTQYQMVLAGGTTNSLTVSKARQFVPQPPIASISLLPTGGLSGFMDINNDKLPFKGVFISPSAGGAGFILDTNGLTDGFQITPQP
jgi:cyclophilin family peptidyl-prolyl cis-trans isomerase